MSGKQREVFSGDVKPQQPAPIDLTKYVPGTAEQGIGAIDDGPTLGDLAPVDGAALKDVVAYDKFMNEMLTIMIPPSDNPHADKLIQVGVNGDMVYIPRNEPVRIKRKYVERLARAKKTTYFQDLEKLPSRTTDAEYNTIIPTRGCMYPFSVVSDPNPNGGPWLTKVLAE